MRTKVANSTDVEPVDTSTENYTTTDSVDEPALFTPDESGAKTARASAGVPIVPWHVYSEADLARIFNKHPVTIRRAVERGELPTPTRLMGKPTWTGTAILKHLEARLATAAEAAQVFSEHARHPSSKLYSKG